MTSTQQPAELQRRIWRIANDVRGSVDGLDFKQYVIVPRQGITVAFYSLFPMLSPGEASISGIVTFQTPAAFLIKLHSGAILLKSPRILSRLWGFSAQRPLPVKLLGGAERKIRKYLIDNNYVETIISLAPNLFYGTSIAVNILCSPNIGIATKLSLLIPLLRR